MVVLHFVVMAHAAALYFTRSRHSLCTLVWECCCWPSCIASQFLLYRKLSGSRIFLLLAVDGDTPIPCPLGSTVEGLLYFDTSSAVDTGAFHSAIFIKYITTSLFWHISRALHAYESTATVVMSCSSGRRASCATTRHQVNLNNSLGHSLPLGGVIYTPLFVIFMNHITTSLSPHFSRALHVTTLQRKWKQSTPPSVAEVVVQLDLVLWSCGTALDPAEHMPSNPCCQLLQEEAFLPCLSKCLEQVNKDGDDLPLLLEMVCNRQNKIYKLAFCVCALSVSGVFFGWSGSWIWGARWATFCWTCSIDSC